MKKMNARLTKYFTKRKKLLQKVMWHNIIENEINLNFEKLNHVVQHHFVRLFFFFFFGKIFCNPSISQ
jgi:hypothetical protein